MKRIVKIFCLICLLVLVAAYLQKEKLPNQENILTKLHLEPVQTKTQAEPFEASVGEVSYTITPIYDYEIYGLVVSYHHSARWWDYYHEAWQDYLNLKDICLVWGENAKNGIYQEMKFKSGSWTCYYEWPNQAVGSKFKANQLANNHLLSDSPAISQKILEARRGDQIYIKGYLSNYAHSGENFSRRTSVSRDDKGNTSCEVIFVTDFQILKAANPAWRQTFTLSQYLLAGSLLALVASLFL